jgi:hypothetical protein
MMVAAKEEFVQKRGGAEFKYTTIVPTRPPFDYRKGSQVGRRAPLHPREHRVVLACRRILRCRGGGTADQHGTRHTHHRESRPHNGTCIHEQGLTSGCSYAIRSGCSRNVLRVCRKRAPAAPSATR